MAYLGLVPLGSALTASILMRDSSHTPKDATGNPAYRIYGPAGLMANGTGSLSTWKDSGVVTNATNANPIVVTTSTPHGLTTGTLVTIASVGGNTAANGDFVVTVTGPTTFSLNGSSGNGAYTSGGTWHVTGLYQFSLTPTGGNGYASGQNYTLLVTATVAGTVRGEMYTFTVV